MKKIFFIGLAALCALKAQEGHLRSSSRSPLLRGFFETQVQPEVKIVFNEYPEPPALGSEFEAPITLFGINMIIRPQQIHIVLNGIDDPRKNRNSLDLGDESGDPKFDLLKKYGPFLNNHASLIYHAALGKLARIQLTALQASFEQQQSLQEHTQDTIKFLQEQHRTTESSRLKNIYYYCQKTQQLAHEAEIEIIKDCEKPLEQLLFDIGYLDKPKS